jgi:hypothetical protein
MLFPESLDFDIRDKLASPRLLHSFSDGSTGLFVHGHDRSLGLSHREHGDRERILIPIGKVAYFGDSPFK